MTKLHDIEFYSDSFFVGALFPFVDGGAIQLMVVHHLDKYKRGEVNTKLPGGSSDRTYASDTKYFERLEQIMESLSYDRRAVLLVQNQEYSRRAEFRDHPDSDGIMWIIQTMVLRLYGSDRLLSGRSESICC